MGKQSSTHISGRCSLICLFSMFHKEKVLSLSSLCLGRPFSVVPRGPRPFSEPLSHRLLFPTRAIASGALLTARCWQRSSAQRGPLAGLEAQGQKRGQRPQCSAQARAPPPQRSHAPRGRRRWQARVRGQVSGHSAEGSGPPAGWGEWSQGSR